MKLNIKSKKKFGIAFLSLVAGLSLLFTVFSENITAYATESLKLCAASVIPSLFPFMVLSSIASKTASCLSGKDSRRTSIFLSVILGALCGFPVGAASVASIYKNGAIEKKEAEHLCALCNNTGPAFVIGVIGGNFWGNYYIGTMFYICQLAAAALVFGGYQIFFGKSETESVQKLRNRKNIAESNSDSPFSANAFYGFSRVFCSAVTESVTNVIQICGYIVFFKVICDTLRMFMPVCYVTDILYAVISSILEFTTGTYSSSLLGGGLGVILCGFSIGFSGLSVMAQSAGLLSKVGLSFAPLFYLKAIIGIVCGILSYVAYRIIPFSYTVTAGAFELDMSVLQYISPAIIITAFILYFIRLIRHPLR